MRTELVLRRPKRIWMPLGLVAAPIAAPFPGALLIIALTGVSYAIWSKGPTSDAFLRFYAVAVIAGWLCAILVGLPRLLLTAAAPRRSRAHVALEATAMGAAFAALVSAVLGSLALILDGPAPGALFSLIFLYGFIVAVLAAPVGGLVFSYIAFERRQREAGNIPPTE